MKKSYLTQANDTIFVLYQDKEYSVANYPTLIQWLVENYHFYLDSYCECPQKGPLTQIWHQNGTSLKLVDVYLEAWKKLQEKKRLKGHKHEPLISYNGARYRHYLQEAVFFKEEGEVAARKKEFSQPFRYDDPYYRHGEKNWKKYRRTQYR
jgi:hypothetical protein